ncbi:bifunctional heptose 7-phosphate kinase/heptose 1-phosphate adenyltransferase [Paenibacillus plantarum]|uniref:bifunctional heptose 7-phosphate kinase/heptose 1-phosphate adenyltransferase n=1 Tax=Paenibacillus plantarum TaxID=2654975 RepID=UPI0014911758|nr:PfkB family carbohydrate kinase [Paenibacillus plantarum]
MVAVNNSYDKKNIKILVIGDYCLDKYYYIDAELDQVADYAIKPSYFATNQSQYPGGAGNVTKNLVSLGADVYCFGIIGNDGAAFELKNSLTVVGANVDNLFAFENCWTNIYLRPIRMSNLTRDTMNEIVCINKYTINQNMTKLIIDKLKEIAPQMDAIVVVEQFNKEEVSVLNSAVKQVLINISKIYNDKIFFVDSRNFIDKYENMHIKCNQFEFAQLINKKNFPLSKTKELLKNGVKLGIKNKAFYLTTGENGMIVFDNLGNSFNIPAISTIDDVDTCGAGDSATAGIVMALCLGYDKLQASLIGNIVASITIKQIGVTGEATFDEVFSLYDEKMKQVGYAKDTYA